MNLADRAKGPLPTHAGDVVLRAPAGLGWDSKDKLDLWGRKVLSVVQSADAVDHEKRHEEIERRLRQLENGQGAEGASDADQFVASVQKRGGAMGEGEGAPIKKSLLQDGRD